MDILEYYNDILSRRTGERKDYGTVDVTEYRRRLKGAFMGRAAGCTLGAPVEGWSLGQIDDYAKETGMTEPYSDYWPSIPEPERVRYIIQTFGDYTRDKICGIPADDDIGYTILAYLIVKEHGRDFTLADVAESWQKYITECYTAERVAMDNLQKGIAPEHTAEIDNPYDEWIGADIRVDGYGYMSPANPEEAARMAYVDSYISHRGEGVYGAMYFAAAIAIAFAVNDTKTALTEALAYIPSDSELYRGLSWAIDLWDGVGDFRNAAKLVDERYPDMHPVHTINNACLTVFALALGGNNIGNVIANSVAMAHDCDCTAATAGSIAGACYGIEALGEQWYKNFGDTVNSFFHGPRTYKISELLEGFEDLAAQMPKALC